MDIDGASPVIYPVKNPPEMQETQFWSLGQEDSLEKEMETHSSILAGIIPWTEEPGRLQSSGFQRVGHNWSNWAGIESWAVCMHAQSLSSVQLFVTAWTAACQAPLSIGLSQQEYWSGLPFPPPEISLTQGSNSYLLQLLHWPPNSLPLSHLGSRRKDY